MHSTETLIRGFQTMIFVFDQEDKPLALINKRRVRFKGVLLKRY